MKILLISHLWKTNTYVTKSGGYQRIAKYLSKNHDVTLLTWGEGDRKIQEGSLKIIIKKTPKTDFLLEKRLYLSYHAAKISKNYDIVHALFPVGGLLPTFNAPVIITEHVTKELDKRIWMAYKSIFQRIVYKRAKHVIAVSNNLFKILKEEYKVNNSSFIPHGIDSNIFKPVNKRRALEKTYKFLKGKKWNFISLTCGSYGLKEKAIKNTVNCFPDILFIFVSSGLEKSLKGNNIVNLKGISENELINLYAASDVLFRPLNFSTANNSILEAMAMGKTVITNRIGGVVDYLDDTCAYLASSDSEFPKLFKKALNNKHEVEEKGQNARLRVEKEFSWEVITPKIIKVYQQVLEDNI